ncbi:ribonucleotide reductase (RNR) inhibitor [Ancistrocladus abbreviatus]
MRSLNSRFELIDLQSSWQPAKQISISTFAYLKNIHLHSPLPAAFHQIRRGHKGFATSRSAIPSIRAPEVRKPSDRIFPGIVSFWNSGASTSTSRSEPTTELDLLLELVPFRMRNELLQHEEIEDLIEIVMDLGRKPLARFPSGDWIISEEPVKREDLQHAISKVGEFSDDNRSGIDRSLHRISAIRNRKRQIIGLTCRVGRAVSGSAEVIRDLIEGGGSILVIGPPGVGKTTLIREIARMLADEHKKRVVIVDTSNEIGGDGDVPHSGIGSARRMQVPNVNMQHNVMIEAVENHMPESIIIDEIGTELEALAASTIAQRGVQLVGTAHGVTIESIIKNPSLQLLVGGIECVTLGDDEAKRRKVQKTVLERKGPPTFACAVEMVSKTECRIHYRLDATVDAILAGKSPLFEVRHVGTEAKSSERSSLSPEKKAQEEFDFTKHKNRSAEADSDEEDADYVPIHVKKRSTNKPSLWGSSPVYVYTYKILEADLLQVAEVMGLEDEIDVTDDIGTADAILACSSEIKQNPWIRGVAKFHQVPVFVIKSNTMAQMVKAIRMILGIESFASKNRVLCRDVLDIEIEHDAPKRKPSLEELDALEEVRLAIEYIVIPGGEPVELLPRRSDIIARQLELVDSYQLAAENSGTELNPRLQILPSRSKKKASTTKYSKSDSNFCKEAGLDSLHSGSEGTTVSRLPLLPE